LDGIVLGVTSVDNELFLLLNRDENQVAVYSINDYKLLRHLDLPGFKTTGDSDMTSCVLYKCLYMSDNCDRCIHRYDLSSSYTSKWRLRGRPLGLSVTRFCTLLVVCRSKPNKLVELSIESGEYIREIALPPDIVGSRHSIQLFIGQFVVCQGDWGWRHFLHRVFVVRVNGEVTNSYGGNWGSDVGQLNSPCHLAVDGDSHCIFVAEYRNSRVVLLSHTLEFIRYVGGELLYPCQVYFHQNTRRLFVGHWVGGVSVIQL